MLKSVESPRYLDGTNTDWNALYLALCMGDQQYQYLYARPTH